ncbi:DUF4148 domain-containing protein [Paraburkholderia unamae]|uniref:Uncharacterized protein DUF4148 n=1 Tax=Paraburkholderia unamae TaxID=219649 RepID=A0ABX5K9K1_9BURK|nr:DUF4148 domain-containing protein [Paraburkholderia unamae]PVX71439.1 uncharacterized protein DUF4148 [Paraburkholderia unamae]CAG9274977.1 conserved exported hypothetical protein [Paraburkholderia unamae]
MKALKLLALAALAAAPVLSFAQSSQPVTRAQVRAELVQLQQAGYNPAADETQYPANIQAALVRVEANQVAQQAASAAYGGVVGATSASSASSAAAAGTHRRDASAASGAQDDVPGLGPIYAHS